MFVSTNFFKNIYSILYLYRLELVQHPSYTRRYRTVRNRYPNEGSPQRGRTTIIRRAPETIISEGNYTINHSIKNKNLDSRVQYRIHQISSHETIFLIFFSI